MKRLTWLSAQDPPDRFPPAEQALEDPPGLLAGGGDLSVARLQAAYARGIFPWYSQGQPVLWWCPDPREVLLPGQLHISRSLARTLRSGRFTVTRNQAFKAVIQACAAPREGASGTWITAQMQSAYLALHAAGVAHSIETWHGSRLVGGLYGVLVGRIFCGESMFSRESDASKVALVGLATQGIDGPLHLIDCQMPSPHLRSLGSRAIPRSQFLRLLAAPSEPFSEASLQ